MPLGIPPANINSLEYAGQPLAITPVVEAQRNPLPTDTNYPTFCLWRNAVNNNAYILVGFSAGSALWRLFQFGSSTGAIDQLTGNSGTAGPDAFSNAFIKGDGTTINVTGDNANTLTVSLIGVGPAIETLTGNSGGAVSPTTGNINIVGDGTTITIAGNPGTHTLTASLIGGGPAVETTTVQQATAPGVTVVTPSSNNINVSGSAVTGHSVPIETRSRALHAYNVEVQYASSAGSATATQSGLAHFNSSQFVVDNTTGFVSLTSNEIFTWQTISASQTLAVFNGYICVSPGGALALALPATATIGNIIEITLDGATSFQITQAAGQQIRYGNQQTTLGVGGSITTTAQGNTIRMVAQSATKWNILASLGNLQVI